MTTNNTGSRSVVRGQDHSHWKTALIDDNRVRGEIDADWIREQSPCRLTADPTELMQQLDSRYLVVVIRSSMSTADGVAKQIWERYPHIQLLSLLSRGEFTTLDETCDSKLQEPYGRQDLQNEVRTLAKHSLYHRRVREYYDLTSYRIGVGSEQDDSPEIAKRLVRRIKRIEQQLEELVATWDREDFEAIWGAHRRRTEALDCPTLDERPHTQSKYRPKRCPKCHLDWGVAHGGRIGNGYERVAALVWRCRDCGHVLRASPGEYDKIL